MTDKPLPREDTSSMEARLAVRRAARDADRDADRLVDRLADVDIHQREARFLLERAGLLRRKGGPPGN
jgi:hypothetical protein